MARIVGVDIPNDKPVGTALTYIYGIGRQEYQHQQYVPYSNFLLN